MISAKVERRLEAFELGGEGPVRKQQAIARWQWRIGRTTAPDALREQDGLHVAWAEAGPPSRIGGCFADEPVAGGRLACTDGASLRALMLVSGLAEHHGADRGGLGDLLPEEMVPLIVTAYTSVEVLKMLATTGARSKEETRSSIVTNSCTSSIVVWSLISPRSRVSLTHVSGTSTTAVKDKALLDINFERRSQCQKGFPSLNVYANGGLINMDKRNIVSTVPVQKSCRQQSSNRRQPPANGYVKLCCKLQGQTTGRVISPAEYFLDIK
ncbi:uncharacterized protein BKA55DRAFT_536395 [Fusarium redolens]|uniref:Uncharacterized protein n=1 Tax=Fusarium redolens TaxID=48865 RepID=A0A9P9HPP6_FUSRE|nr:uncharacterized protein BKA55DRAFT_536395 [Fusarium redolens]KAH7261395.1 hypothetical protein BKA55DRAFT_536395 [Fusarium redolens]